MKITHRGAQHVCVRVRRADAGALQAKRISRAGEGDVARAVHGGAGGGRDGVGGGGLGRAGRELRGSAEENGAVMNTV